MRTLIGLVAGLGLGFVLFRNKRSGLYDDVEVNGLLIQTEEVHYFMC